MPTAKDILVRKATDADKATCGDWPIWECEAKTFDWDYTQKEMCLILEGKVTVRDRNGESSVSFGKGDYVEFPNGLKCVWQVTEPVRKHYDFE